MAAGFFVPLRMPFLHPPAVHNFWKFLSETGEAIVRWVSEKVLESYRNGITAGQKGATVKRQGLSRRPFPRRAE
jgi:hypothetical protein